jgi:hypothetical protein
MLVIYRAATGRRHGAEVRMKNVLIVESCDWPGSDLQGRRFTRTSENWRGGMSQLHAVPLAPVTASV